MGNELRAVPIKPEHRLGGLLTQGSVRCNSHSLKALLNRNSGILLILLTIQLRCHLLLVRQIKIKTSQSASNFLLEGEKLQMDFLN